MGKAGTKRKKAEKAKTQLKAKKSFKLPKGANQVTPNLSVKRLTVVNHVKSRDASDGEPLTKKRLNFQDLMSKCGHQGVSVRLDALTGLREIVVAHPTLVDDHRGDLLKKLLPMAHDRENNVRTKSIALVETVLQTGDPLRFESFYDILCAHICCALTHIDRDIRRDGLRLLDGVIGSHQGFVARKYKELLPNCVGLIAASKGSGAQTKQVLDSSVSSKIPTLVLRCEVIQRIKTILSITTTTVDRPATVQPLRMDFTQDAENHAGLYRRGAPALSLSSVFEAKRDDDKWSLAKMAADFLPLLIETWCEARTVNAKKDKTSRSSLVAGETVEILEAIVETVHLLVQLLDLQKDQAFHSLIESNVTKHLFFGFPYSSLPSAGRKKSVETKDCSELNVDIATVFLKTCSNPGTEDGERIVKYVRDLLASPASLRDPTLRSITWLLWILSEHSDGTVDDMIGKLHRSRPNSEPVQSFMARLAVSDRSLRSVDEWISQLPSRLGHGETFELAHAEAAMELQRRLDQRLLKGFREQSSAIKEALSSPRYKSSLHGRRAVLVLELLAMRCKNEEICDVLRNLKMSFAKDCVG